MNASILYSANRPGTNMLGNNLMTWLSQESDLNSFQLDNYHMISRGQYCSKHGGQNIYIDPNMQKTYDA